MLEHDPQPDLPALFRALADPSPVGYVAVVITDDHGKRVPQTEAQGPYMLVKLPTGSYKVCATYNGKARVTRPRTEWR